MTFTFDLSIVREMATMRIPSHIEGLKIGLDSAEYEGVRARRRWSGVF